MRISYLLAAGLLIAATGTGVAVASTKATTAADPVITSSDGRITACVDRKTGDVRIFKDGTCREGEKIVKWSVRGPRGPVGPQGSSSSEGAGSVAYIEEPDDVSVPSDSTETVTLTSMTLPAGSYVATYTANGRVALGAGYMTCRLTVADTTEGIGVVRMGVGSTTIAMTGAFTAANATQAEVSCISDISTEVSNQALTLTQVSRIVVGQQPSCPRTAHQRRC